jgi:hypothetical protein
MIKNKHDIFVITRYGLGQQQDIFYKLSLPYLVNFLAESIKNQTDNDFIWILLVDSKMPNWVHDKLEILKDSISNLHIAHHDLFSDYNLMPNLNFIYKGIIKAETGRVTTIRIDADDILHSNFISIVRGLVSKKSLKNRGIVINIPLGVYFYDGRDRHLLVKNKNYSIQVYSDIYDHLFKDVYSFGTHKDLSKKVKDVPFSCSVSVDNDYPLWIRVIHKNSDSKRVVRNNYLMFKFLTLYYRVNKFFRLSDLEIKSILSTKNVESIFDQRLSGTYLNGASEAMGPVPKSILGVANPYESRLYTKVYILDILKYGSEYIGRHESESLKKIFYSF